MAVDSETRLVAALAQAQFDEVCGTLESDWVDFKGSPYQLDVEQDRLELAKDVSALSNGAGGVLVIGYSTEKYEDSPRDYAARHRPITRSLIDETRYRDVIEQWTYPPIRELECNWWPNPGDRGVFTIHVRAARESERPILVTKLGTEGVREGLLFGVFVRVGDRVRRIHFGELHRWMHDGRARATGAAAGVGLQDTEQEPSEQTRELRLEDEIRAADLAGRPRYFLQAWPRADIRIPTLYEDESVGIRHMLTRGRQLRQSGFNLRTDGASTDLAGGGIRTNLREGSMSFQPSGLLTMVVAATDDFLAWADERRGRKGALHPLALVESTLEFARLYVERIRPQFVPANAPWSLAGGLESLISDGSAVSLAPGSSLSRLGRFPEEFKPALQGEFRFGPLLFSDEPPGVVAFQALAEIYGFFRLPSSAIPYAEEGQVDPVRLTNIPP